MTQECKVIKIVEPIGPENAYSYESVYYFNGLTTDQDDVLTCSITTDIRNPMWLRVNTDEDKRKVDALIALVKTFFPKRYKVTVETVKIEC